MLFSVCQKITQNVYQNHILLGGNFEQNTPKSDAKSSPKIISQFSQNRLFYLSIPLLLQMWGSKNDSKSAVQTLCCAILFFYKSVFRNLENHTFSNVRKKWKYCVLLKYFTTFWVLPRSYFWHAPGPSEWRVLVPKFHVFLKKWADSGVVFGRSSEVQK